MTTKEIVSEIVGKIKNQFKPQKIILFGSYAWGKPTEALIHHQKNKKTRWPLRTGKI